MPKYHFVVAGEVTERSMMLLPTFSSRVEQGQTVLTTDVIDQAHLVGIVQELSDLGLVTISVTRAGALPPSSIDRDDMPGHGAEVAIQTRGDEHPGNGIDSRRPG